MAGSHGLCFHQWVKPLNGVKIGRNYWEVVKLLKGEAWLKDMYPLVCIWGVSCPDHFLSVSLCLLSTMRWRILSKTFCYGVLPFYVPETMDPVGDWPLKPWATWRFSPQSWFSPEFCQKNDNGDVWLSKLGFNIRSKPTGQLPSTQIQKELLAFFFFESLRPMHRLNNHSHRGKMQALTKWARTHTHTQVHTHRYSCTHTEKWGSLKTRWHTTYKVNDSSMRSSSVGTSTSHFSHLTFFDIKTRLIRMSANCPMTQEMIHFDKAYKMLTVDSIS